MFSIRPDQASTNQGVSSRMKPARQITCTPASRRAASIACSCAWRSLPNGRESMASACTPSARAASSPPASGTLETTRAISAG